MPLLSCPRLLFLLAAVALVSACRQPAEKLFAFSTDAPSRAGLVPVGAGGVLVGNEAGKLALLEGSGKPLWSVDLGSEVAARPVLASTAQEEAVLAGTVEGVLVRLALATGEERWRLTGQPPMLTPLVAEGESVYVVTSEGAVRAHALSQGTLRWQQNPFSEGSKPATPTALPAPVVGEGLLVVVTAAGLAALSTADGTVRWRRPLEQVLGVEVEGKALYATTRGGRVLALELTSGQVRWEQTPGAALSSPPTLLHGQLWVGAPGAESGSAPMLWGLSPESGQVETQLKLPAPLGTRVTAFKSLLLVPTQSQQGWLVALSPSRPEPLFILRLDTPLRTPLLMQEEQLYVLGKDGRVLSWRLRVPTP